MDDHVVDARVGDAIEDLNAAADSLNRTEDTRSAAEAAAQRARVLVREELDMLDGDSGKLLKRMVPFLEARETARAALAELRTAKADNEAAKAAAAALKRSNSKDPTAQAASMRAADAKRAEKAAARFADNKVVRLGELGEAVQRYCGDVADAERAYLAYMDKRRGLLQVLQESDARLGDLAQAKEAAHQRHLDAMDNLEALSEELREVSRTPSVENDGGNASSDAAATEWNANGSNDAASRPSHGALSDPDSGVEAEFSEEESDELEVPHKTRGGDDDGETRGLWRASQVEEGRARRISIPKIPGQLEVI